MSQNTNQPEALALCPFCGSHVKSYQQTSKVPDNWAVRCDVCGAQCGPSSSGVHAKYNWNTRVAALSAPTPEPDAGREDHPDDAAVDRFAAAMKAKLAEARAKGRGGWDDMGDTEMHAHLCKLLRDHVEKGDPRDVANFCMFLHQRGEPILAATSTQQGGEPLGYITMSDLRDLEKYDGLATVVYKSPARIGGDPVAIYTSSATRAEGVDAAVSTIKRIAEQLATDGCEGDAADLLDAMHALADAQGEREAGNG